MSKTHKTPEKRRPSIFLLLVIVLAGAITGLALQLSMRSKAPPAPSSDLYPLMDSISHAVSVKYNEYRGLKRTWLAETATGDPVPVTGYDFSITTDAYPSILIYAPATHYVDDSSKFVTPAHNLDAVNSVVASVFTSHGFVGQPDQVDQVSAYAPKTLYTKQDETCTTTSNVSYYQVTIVCTSPSLQQQLAAQAKPLVTAYSQANPGVKATDVTFGPMVIKSKDATNSPIGTSKTKGYDIAEALFRFSDGSKELALYYQKGSGSWHYIAKAGDEFGFSCSIIESNPDARKALNSQPCYDHSKQRISKVGS